MIKLSYILTNTYHRVYSGFAKAYSDIFKFCGENTPIMFMGDFNGRTGDADDTFRGEGNFGNHAIPTPNTFVDLPKSSRIFFKNKQQKSQKELEEEKKNKKVV